MEKLLLIDGNSVMNRAFFGVSLGMHNKDGIPTNAMYGFLNILFKNLADVNPKYVAVVFDSHTGSQKRKNLYSGYKKNRKQMSEELKIQMTEIRKVLASMNIYYVDSPDLEGDDILGTLSKRYSSKQIESNILSGDRDMFQLIGDNSKVLLLRGKYGGKDSIVIYDKKRLKKEFNLSPEQMIDLKGLMGDSSDEIPGAKGVGEKTALKLVNDFKNIDNLYNIIENDEDKTKGLITPRILQILKDDKEKVYLSKRLGTIDINGNLDTTLKDMKYTTWKNKDSLETFKYYGFFRFIERFKLNEINFETEDLKFDNEKNDKLPNLEESRNIAKVQDLSKISGKDEIFFYFDKSDDETEGKIIKKKINGLGFYEKDENKTYYFENINDNFFYEQIKDIFEDKNIKKIGYDIKEDYVLLLENGIKIENIYYDNKISCYDIDPVENSGNKKLTEMAEKYLDFDEDSIKINSGKQISLFDTEEDEQDSHLQNIGIFSYLIYELYNTTFKILEKNDQIKLFNTIEIPLIKVLGSMQFYGIKCEKDKLEEFGKELEQEKVQIEKEIYNLAGEEFNINSPKQLGVILFEKMGLPYTKKTKTGYATNEETLRKLESKNEIAGKILTYRGITKLKSTYVDGIIPVINKKTGRIHSFFHQTITATGRISSTEPNLQNIPTRDEYGKNIRKAFIPKEGYVYVDADYSQVELRILANMSNDENMKKAFLNGEDIHKEVASQVFNTPINEVTKEQRSRAKAVNFGIVYGISAFGLSNQLKCSLKEANEYINKYLEKFSNIKKYMEETIEYAEKNGYVKTLFGRKRYINELHSSNYNLREFGKRAAMNTPIQGTAADIMKIAMNNVYSKLQEEKIDGKIILQIHDELLLEVKEEQKEQAKKILKEQMENAYKLEVPLKVEVSEGNTWYNVK